MANTFRQPTQSDLDREQFRLGLASAQSKAYTQSQANASQSATETDYTTAPDRISLSDLNKLNQSILSGAPQTDSSVLDFWKRQQAARSAVNTDYTTALDRISFSDLRQKDKSAVQNDSQSDAPAMERFQRQQAAKSAANADYTTAPDRVSLYDLNRLNQSILSGEPPSDGPVLDLWKRQQAAKSAAGTDYTTALDRMPFTQVNTWAGGNAAGTKTTNLSAAGRSAPWLNTPLYGDDGAVLSTTAAQTGKAGYNGSDGQAGVYGPDTDYTYAPDRVPFTQVNARTGGTAAGTKATNLSSAGQSAPWLNTPQYGDDGAVLSQDSTAQGQNTLPYDFGDDGAVFSQDKLAQYGSRGYDEIIWEDNPVRKGLRQVFLGNYAGETTPLGTTLQILAGLAGVDAPADVRDLFYDLTHWEDTPEHRWQLMLDLVAVLPLIGALKNADKAGELAQEVLSHGDEISDVLNALHSGADEAAELIGDLAKHSDEAEELAQDALKHEDEIDKVIREVFDEEDDFGKTFRNTLDDEDDWLKDIDETIQSKVDYEPDIIIGKSVGAKAKNYDIFSPDGEILNLTEGSRIRNVEVIAGQGRNRQIDMVDSLVDKYGGNRVKWKKCKGLGYVDVDGESYLVELHWYEEPSTGRVEFKIKRQPGGAWFINED